MKVKSRAIFKLLDKLLLSSLKKETSIDAVSSDMPHIWLFFIMINFINKNLY